MFTDNSYDLHMAYMLVSSILTVDLKR